MDSRTDCTKPVPLEFALSSKEQQMLIEANRALSSQVQSLEAWKQEAIVVEKQWDVQKIGELIGATPGQHIRPLIQPFIESPVPEQFR